MITEITPEMKRATEEFDGKVEAFREKHGGSYSQALSATRTAFPVLFARSEGKPEPAANGETEFDRLVREHQYANNCGYEEALAAVRDSHQALWQKVEA